MVYGIGNPLIDIIIDARDEDIARLGIHKGTMALIDEERREELLELAEGREISYSCGGSCPNTIIALASLGVETTLAGKLGADSYATIYRERLAAFGVRDELVSTDRQKTGSTIILISEDSERSMNTFLGANRLYAEDDVSEESVKNADIFHFTGYMWDTTSQRRAIERALAIAKEHGTTVSFDVADPFAVGRYHKAFLRLIEESCDIVFANREEARILFDNYDPYECCRSMGKLCRIAIVKDGNKGSFIAHEGTIIKIPPKGTPDPVDTTGAGDVYAAGFLYAQTKGMNIESSGTIASILAGEIVTQRGAQFGEEKAKELRILLEHGGWRQR
ncbi:MAG: adenosine kinase [Spirochaetales bacterium]|nr:adenosine kinase [Spirochaetales bacterium]